MFFPSTLFLYVLLLITHQSSSFYLKSLKSNNYNCNLPKVNAAMVDCEDGNFGLDVLQSSSPVLVDFHANWCGPCKLMAPIFKQLAEEFDDVKFVKVDTGFKNLNKFFNYQYNLNILSKDIHEDSIDQYNIQGLPMFALFVKGKVISSHSGAISKEPLREFVKSNLLKHSTKI
jgi:thioredoxin 1